jgi:cytochrome c oxidase cbb3-type subunit 4
MSSGTALGVVTALMMAIFIGVVIWSWSGARRARFDAAARLPLEKEHEP